MATGSIWLIQLSFFPVSTRYRVDDRDDFIVCKYFFCRLKLFVSTRFRPGTGSKPGRFNPVPGRNRVDGRLSSNLGPGRNRVETGLMAVSPPSGGVFFAGFVHFAFWSTRLIRMIRLIHPGTGMIPGRNCRGLRNYQPGCLATLHIVRLHQNHRDKIC